MGRITGYAMIDKRGLQCNGAFLYTNENLPAGDLLRECYRSLACNYPRFAKMDTLCRLAFLTAEAVVQRLPASDYGEYDTGVILSNRNASLNTDFQYMETVKQIPSPALFVCTLPNVAAAEIGIRNKFKGEQNFFIAPDFDAAFFFDYLTLLFERKQLKRALCGWTEVLHNDFKSFIFVVEETGGQGALFTPENIRNLYAH